MTLPCERYNAIKYTERFLMDLCDPKKTPRVPREIRNMARGCLRHYPSGYNLDIIATMCPDQLQTPKNDVKVFRAKELPARSKK